MSRVIAALMAIASGASIAQAQTAARPSQAATDPPFILERALAPGGAAFHPLVVSNAGVQAVTARRVVVALRPSFEMGKHSSEIRACSSRDCRSHERNLRHESREIG